MLLNGLGRHWSGIVIGVIGDRYWWPGMHGRAYPAPVIGMYVKVPEAAGLASPQDISRTFSFNFQLLAVTLL